MQEIADDHRALTQDEMRLVRWLLENSWAVTQELLEQLDKLEVVSQCPSGCACIDFFEYSGLHLISEAEGRNQDGNPIGVLLFVCDDRLAALETYSIDGSDVGTETPHPDNLTLWSSLE